MSTTLSVTPSQEAPPLKSTSAPTNPEWRKVALAVIKRLAKRRKTLISADVLDKLATSDVKTPDLRAIGSVMREASALGIIESSGLVRDPNNTHSRSATTPWKSRICRQRHTSDAGNS